MLPLHGKHLHRLDQQQARIAPALGPRPYRSVVSPASSQPSNPGNGLSADRLLGQARGSAVHVPDSAPSTSETGAALDEIRCELNMLKDVVSLQQREISRRDLTVSQLQNKLLQVQQEIRVKNDPQSRDSRGNLRPLEAQRRAIADRRGMGMYDARYHSTSWLASRRGPCLHAPNGQCHVDEAMLAYSRM